LALPSCQSPRGPYDRRILEAKGGLAMVSFEGKRALVAGGGRGIGRAIALAFARQGADVALAARGRDELDAVAGEIRGLGRKAFIHVVDLADTDQAVNMVNAAAWELGSLYILRYNAGRITEGPG